MVACGQIYPAVDAGVNKTSSFLHRLRCQKLTHLRTRFCFEACFGWFKERCCKIFTGGEWGLFPVVASLRMTLAPPPSTGTERKKIFQFDMFHVKHLAINISKHFTFWHVSCMGMWVSRLKMLDNFCQTLDKNVEL